jgi:hypothetical protein
VPGVYRYIFTNFDQITQPVMGSKRIGFAIPLKGDEFFLDVVGCQVFEGKVLLLRASGLSRV